MTGYAIAVDDVPPEDRAPFRERFRAFATGKETRLRVPWLDALKRCATLALVG